MTAAKTKAITLDQYDLKYLSEAIEKLQDAGVYVENATLNLNDQPFAVNRNEEENLVLVLRAAS